MTENYPKQKTCAMSSKMDELAEEKLYRKSRHPVELYDTSQTKRQQHQNSSGRSSDEYKRTAGEKTVDVAEITSAFKQEIADRKHTEQSLQNSGRRYRHLLEAVTDYIYSVKVVDGQPIATVHEPNCVAVTGYTPEDYEADPYLWYQMVYEADRQMVLAQADRILSGEKSVAIEHRVIKKDGAIRWVKNTVLARFDEQKQLVGYDGLITDITERKRAEEALHASEARYRTLEANLRAILDNSQQAFILIAPNLNIQAFNNTANEIFLLISGQEIKQHRPILDYLPDQDIDEFKQNFDQALRGNAIKLEKKLSLKDIDKWFELNYNPVLANDGQVIGVCFYTINIDQRKQAADALVANEARLFLEMGSVLAISRALVSELNFENLMDFIIGQTKHLTNSDNAVVLALDDEEKRLELIKSKTVRHQIGTGSQLLVEGCLAEKALKQHQAQMADTEKNNDLIEPIRAFLQTTTIHSLLCAPLTFQNKNLGLLLTWNTKQEIFTEADRRLLDMFADQAALALQNARLHAQNLQLAVVQERQRLARDLHDSVTQSLYSIGLAAQASLRQLSQGFTEKAREPIEYISILSQDALAEMRENLYQMHPKALTNVGFIEALTQYCNVLSKRHKLDVKISSSLPQASLPIEKQNILYFIAREALWNVVKHATAEHVQVMLSKENDQIVLSIEDDGQGFAPAVIPAETLGLRTMKERARQLRGTLEMHSKPKLGTKLIVRIPV